MSILNKHKLEIFAPQLDLEKLMENLNSIQSISLNDKFSGPIRLFDITFRFRWLTPHNLPLSKVIKYTQAFVKMKMKL